MDLYEQYEQEWNKYKDLDRNLYNWEIFIVCYDGTVCKGNEDSVIVSKSKVLYIPEKGEVKEFTPNEIEHITYNITSQVPDAL